MVGVFIIGGAIVGGTMSARLTDERIERKLNTACAQHRETLLALRDTRVALRRLMQTIQYESPCAVTEALLAAQAVLPEEG
jgi:hypothetical protein